MAMKRCKSGAAGGYGIQDHAVFVGDARHRLDNRLVRATGIGKDVVVRQDLVSVDRDVEETVSRGGIVWGRLSKVKTDGIDRAGNETGHRISKCAIAFRLVDRLRCGIKDSRSADRHQGAICRSARCKWILWKGEIPHIVICLELPVLTFRWTSRVDRHVG